MVIVFGYKTKKTKAVEAKELTCEHCGKTGSVIIQYYQQYLHVLWMPMLPASRFATATCTNCGHSVHSKEMKGAYQAAYNQLRPAPPAWMFIGMVVLAAGIGYAAWGKMHKQQVSQEQANACQGHIEAGRTLQVGVSDNYMIDPNTEGKRNYSTLVTIAAVQSDTVYFYKSLFVREADEDMTSTHNYDPQLSLQNLYRLPLAQFEKLPIFHCR